MRKYTESALAKRNKLSRGGARNVSDALLAKGVEYDLRWTKFKGQRRRLTYAFRADDYKQVVVKYWEAVAKKRGGADHARLS